MHSIRFSTLLIFSCLFSSLLCSCSIHRSTDFASEDKETKAKDPIKDFFYYAARLPQNINTYGEKVVLIDPNVHTWGAYDASGKIVQAGLTSAGADWCFDMGRPCKTKAGVFRVYSLGSPECKSTIFPIPEGGAPMPYCMFFNRGQALHGVHEGEVVEGNVSHGCVRLHIPDAYWLRYNFVDIGTKVIVRPY